MKIFDSEQTRTWDAYTIQHEPIASADLMNRAARVFADWFAGVYPDTRRPVVVVAGTGNNGGDGLVAARLLHWLNYEVKVLVCDFNGKRSADFLAQLAPMPEDVDVVTLENPAGLQEITLFGPAGASDAPIIIEALFGTGLNRPLEGSWAQVIDYLNTLPNEIVSIDLPAGLLADKHTPGNAVVKATRTFSFESPKRAFLFPENAERVGDWEYGSIGLHLDFYNKTETPFHYLTRHQAGLLLRPRTKFSHKGTFGHALLIAGSYGKMGAAVLAARACLRSGAGLLTVHAPRIGFLALQTAVPEAMYSPGHRAHYWTETPDLQPFQAIGIGCGIGQAPETAAALEEFFRMMESGTGGTPGLVLDADALNLLAQHPHWWRLVPRNTIITPHPKEFERLFGKTADDFERNDLQRRKAQEHGIFIILKGAHTAIACPDGACWFNSTGNPGMAKGGSGDVLTGLLTGLLAQRYAPRDAALLGVFLHGLAGDRAAAEKSERGMTAGDLAEAVGKVWNW